jgi:hypothetical protein
MAYMKLNFSILIILLCCGCAIKDDYPTNWTPLSVIAKAGCQNISGEFLNVGENTLEGGERNLSYILAPDFSVASETERVNIEIVDEIKMQLGFIDKYGKKTSTELSTSAGLLCKDGVYTIERSEFLNSGGAIGKQWYSYRLHSSPDSLIVEKKQGAVGALFFIPIVGTETHWLRFKRP